MLVFENSTPDMHKSKQNVYIAKLRKHRIDHLEAHTQP